MRNALSFVRILSLDVVLGALASSYLVVCWLQVEMPVIFWWALPLSVWVIYTADHLLDAHRLKDQAHTPRHLFHFQYHREIMLGFIPASFICVFVLPFLVPNVVFYFAVVMGIFTGLHFLLVKWIGDRISWFFLKELGVGAIYVAGVWGVPVLLKPDPLDLLDLHFALQFFLLAMINLLCFSMYEIETDEKDGHTSFVRAIGKQKTRQVLLFLSLGITGSAVWVFLQEIGNLGIWVQGVFLFMLLVLSWVIWDEKRFRKQEQYRIWADAVFIFPSVIVLICPGL